MDGLLELPINYQHRYSWILKFLKNFFQKIKFSFICSISNHILIPVINTNFLCVIRDFNKKSHLFPVFDFYFLISYSLHEFITFDISYHSIFFISNPINVSLHKKYSSLISNLKNLMQNKSSTGSFRFSKLHLNVWRYNEKSFRNPLKILGIYLLAHSRRSLCFKQQPTNRLLELISDWSTRRWRSKVAGDSTYQFSFFSLLRYLFRYSFLLYSCGQQGGHESDDDVWYRCHLSREPRDAIGSLKIALTFNLRFDLVHLRFYRISQFWNSQNENVFNNQKIIRAKR